MVTALQPETRPLPGHTYTADERLQFARVSSLHLKGQRLAVWKMACAGLCMGLALGALAGIFCVGQLAPLTIATLIGLSGLAGALAAFSCITRKQAVENKNLFMAYALEAAKDMELSIISATAPSQVVVKPSIFPITTMLYTGEPNGPVIDTHEREEVLASARKALLTMDHTKITVH